MPRVIEKTVFKFDELSNDAKGKARDWCRGWIADDWNPLDDNEWLTETAALLGINIGCGRGGGLGINYSVGSYDDFVVFKGSWTYRPEAVDEIAKERPTDAELLRIANELQRAWVATAMAGGTELTASMTTRSTGRSGETMDIEVESDVADEDGFTVAIPNFAAETVGECMTDFAHWMLGSFQSHLEWLNSDECIDETIEANEYEFDEDGNA